MKIIEGNVIVNNANIAIVVSKFNDFIHNQILNDIIYTLKQIGQVKDQNITIIKVPGTCELSLIIHKLAISKKYHALIALGTIIKGSTMHYKYIAKECITRLSYISVNTMIPIISGILITKNTKQAIECINTKNHKGTELALTTLEMINILKLINEK